MPYRVEILPAAQKEIREVGKADQRRVIDAIAALVDDPRPYGCKKLKGTDDLYRVRQGQYRIIYAVSDAKALVLAVRVGHRRDVYDNLRELGKRLADL